MCKKYQAEYNQCSNNNRQLTQSYYMVSGCMDLSLLDLTFSCVLTQLGEKDSVS